MGNLMVIYGGTVRGKNVTFNESQYFPRVMYPLVAPLQPSTNGNVSHRQASARWLDPLDKLTGSRRSRLVYTLYNGHCL